MNPEDTIALIMALRLARSPRDPHDTVHLRAEAQFAAQIMAAAKTAGLPRYLERVKEWRDQEAKDGKGSNSA